MQMRAFHFEKALMEEHFNESYVSPTPTPKPRFKGKSKDGIPNGPTASPMTLLRRAAWTSTGSNRPEW